MGDLEAGHSRCTRWGAAVGPPRAFHMGCCSFQLGSRSLLHLYMRRSRRTSLSWTPGDMPFCPSYWCSCLEPLCGELLGCTGRHCCTLLLNWCVTYGLILLGTTLRLSVSKATSSESCVRL